MNNYLIVIKMNTFRIRDIVILGFMSFVLFVGDGRVFAGTDKRLPDHGYDGPGWLNVGR